MRKMWLVFLSGLVLLSSCSRTAQEKAEKIKVGVIGKCIAPYWDVVRIGAEDAGEKLGVKVTFFAPAAEDINRQIQTLEAWAGMGMRGICFAPSDPDAVVPLIKKVTKQGIVCVAIDSDSPRSGRVAYLGTDNYIAGKLAGEKLAEIINKKGKVAICTGSLTAMNSLQRIKGFRNAVMKYPGIQIVEPVLCDYEDTAKAVELAETCLLNNSDLRAFFCVYAFNGPSAAKAVRTSGRKGKVHIVAFDTTDEHLYLIKEGLIDAAVGQRQYLMGYLGVMLLNDLVRLGEKNVLTLLPKNQKGDIIINTGIDIVTRDNLGEYVKLLDSWGVKHTFK